MVLAIALGSSFAFALASVLQHASANRAAAGKASIAPLSLMTSLLRRPAFAAGLAADGVGYGLQALALHEGPMVVVQPVLAAGLLFALPMAAALARARPSRADLAAAAAIVAGLSVFLVEARPARGAPGTSFWGWVAVMSSCLAAAVLLTVAGRSAGGARRAALLAVAAGDLFGLSAALTKTSVHLLAAGLPQLVGSWQPYALAAVGTFGFVVGQEAFAAAPLSASLPLLTVVDPLVSIAIGAGAFGERLASGGGAPFLEAAGLALLGAGLFFSARSSLLAPAIPSGGSLAGRAGDMEGQA